MEKTEEKTKSYYFEVDGLCRDRDGNPCAGALVISFPVSEDFIDDGKVPENLIGLVWEDFADIFKDLGIGKENIRVITEEYYLSEYGEDED